MLEAFIIMFYHISFLSCIELFFRFPNYISINTNTKSKKKKKKSKIKKANRTEKKSEYPTYNKR